MKAKIKKSRSVMLGGEPCEIPQISQDDYLDYLDVREDVMSEQAERSGYTRAQFTKMRDTVRQIYANAGERIGRASAGEIIAAFVAVEAAVAGETGDAVEAVRANFQAGDTARPS